jgi:PBP1b-binding outer membrane lipoprotein LpoB
MNLKDPIQTALGALVEGQSASDLAKAAQKPIASMISVPNQSTINYG